MTSHVHIRLSQDRTARPKAEGRVQGALYATQRDE
jgi:hypothetical protein